VSRLHPDMNGAHGRIEPLEEGNLIHDDQLVVSR
jgi:hypothetical protein